MTVHHRLHRARESIETLTCIEGEQNRQKILISFACHQVMEEDPFLERRQGIDILNVRCPSWHGTHHSLDLGWGQIQQRQHLWREGQATLRNEVGWNRDAMILTTGSNRKALQGR